MNAENQPAIVEDLFGDLVTLPSGRRGRPAHCWTKRNADKVILGLAMDYSDKEIAFGLGISVPTLRKYYFSELKRREMQKLRFQLWQMEKLADLANGGNVGALKELRRIEADRRAEVAAQRMRDAPEDEDDAPIGKKEAARRAAETAVADDPDLTPGNWTH